MSHIYKPYFRSRNIRHYNDNVASVPFDDN